MFLAGCETFDVSDQSLKTFMKTTGAAALAGYANSVDWLEAAQMDLIVLGALAKHGPGATGVWGQAPSKTLDDVYAEHQKFADRLVWQFEVGEADGDSWLEPRHGVADGSVAAVGELARVAADESVDTDTRLRVITSLGALGARSALTTFTAIVRDTDAPVRLRQAAVRALAGIEGGHATQALRRLDQSLAAANGAAGATSVRKAVASALRSRGG